MFNITSYSRNANQKCYDISPHTGQNGYQQKNPQITKAGESVERRKPSCTVGGNVNWYTHYGEQYAGSKPN